MSGPGAWRRALFLCIRREEVPIFDTLTQTIAATLQLSASSEKTRQIQKMGKTPNKAFESAPIQTAVQNAAPKSAKKAKKEGKNSLGEKKVAKRKGPKRSNAAESGGGGESSGAETADAISIQINDDEEAMLTFYGDNVGSKQPDMLSAKTTEWEETESGREDGITEKSEFFCIWSLF